MGKRLAFHLANYSRHCKCSLEKEVHLKSLFERTLTMIRVRNALQPREHSPLHVILVLLRIGLAATTFLCNIPSRQHTSDFISSD